MPYLQIIPLEMTVAERWFYFPMVGLLGTIGVGIVVINSKHEGIKTSGLLLSVITLSILGLRTVIRNTNWKNSYTLFSHDVEVDPNNFYLQNKVGIELYQLGKYEDAGERFQRSISLRPTASAFSSLGLVNM